MCGNKVHGGVEHRRIDGALVNEDCQAFASKLCGVGTPHTDETTVKWPLCVLGDARDKPCGTSILAPLRARSSKVSRSGSSANKASTRAGVRTLSEISDCFSRMSSSIEPLSCESPSD